METKTEHSEFPKLRPVEAFPVKAQGQQLICLRDPEQLAVEPILLSYPAFFIASRFSGSDSLADIQAAFFRQYGELLYLDKIRDLIQMLDEKHFLSSPGFENYRSRQLEEFRRSSARPPAHAGTAYDLEPAVLHRRLDSFFEHPEGIGTATPIPPTARIRGLVAPHIDFQRGGPVYSWAYGTLRNHPPHDLYIIFGTSHSGLPQPFCLTRKSFETPLGVVETDPEMTDLLLNQGPPWLTDGEWFHRAEHSIEFQVVFLQHLFPDRRLRIVPILCGGLLDSRQEGQEMPPILPEATDFLELLSTRAAQDGRTICFIAGADLAHMGPRFGDRAPVDSGLLQWLRSADLSLMNRLERIAAQEFVEEILREQDRRRICGLWPIYSLLRTCGAAEGKLLRYDQAVDPQGSQVVSFAGLVFFGDRGPKANRSITME